MATQTTTWTQVTTEKKLKSWVYEIAFRVLRNQPNMVADEILHDEIEWPASRGLEPLMRHICEEVGEKFWDHDHLRTMVDRLKEGDVAI